MKKIVSGMFLFFVTLTINATTLTTSKEQNLTPPSQPPAPTTRCKNWKQIFYKKTYCAYRQGLREGCYRCVNYNQFGFHLYPREMERTSCNQNTVDYLRTMGYRCYMPYNNSPCLRTVQRELCDWTCADAN